MYGLYVPFVWHNATPWALPLEYHYTPDLSLVGVQYPYILENHSTVIRENFVVKNFRLTQNDDNFFTLLVILYTANIYIYMACIDMNDYIVTRKFLTQYFGGRN